MSFRWQSPMTLWTMVAGAQGSRVREPAPLWAPGRPGSSGQARHSKSLFRMIAEIAILSQPPSLTMPWAGSTSLLPHLFSQELPTSSLAKWSPPHAPLCRNTE